MDDSDIAFDSYIAGRDAPVRDVLEDLRRLVHEALPDAAEGFKWGAPVFDNAHGVTVVYLYGGKDHANLGFVRGAELDDPAAILKGRGKAGRHVRIFPGAAIPRAELAALLRQCAALE